MERRMGVETYSWKCEGASLAEAATSISFVATKVLMDSKHVFVATKKMLRQA